MWSIMFWLTVPAAIFDWWQTSFYDSNCKSMYGEEWKAFSKFAATGRNDVMLMLDTSARPCYNPTQCGFIHVKNDNIAQTSTYDYYLNYVYDASADKSINPLAG